MNKENCALKLVDEITLYYDARSKKHKKRQLMFREGSGKVGKCVTKEIKKKNDIGDKETNQQSQITCHTDIKKKRKTITNSLKKTDYISEPS